METLKKKIDKIKLVMVVKQKMSLSCHYCLQKKACHICSGCKTTAYCNEICQKHDWSKIHFMECGAKQGAKSSSGSNSVDDLLKQAEYQLKNIPPLDTSTAKKFEKIAAKSLLGSVITDQLHRLHDIVHQKVVIDNLITDALEMSNIKPVHVQAFNAMWKQAEKHSNHMLTDLENLEKHKEQMDKEMSKIQVLMDVVLKNDSVEEHLYYKSTECQVDAYKLTLEAYLRQMIDKYMKEHPELKFVPKNATVTAFLNKSSIEGSFIHDLSFQPVQATTGKKTNYDTDDEDDSSFEPSSNSEDEEGNEENGDEESSIESWRYPDGSIGIAPKYEFETGVQRNIKTDLIALERMIQGLPAEPMSWGQTLMYPLHWTAQGRPIKLFTTGLVKMLTLVVKREYAEKGVGAILAIVGALTVITSGVMATMYFNEQMAKTTRQVYQGFDNVWSGVASQKEAAELMQKTIAELDNDICQVQNLIPEGLKPTSVAKMYWELVARMDDATIDQKKSAALTLLTGWVDHLRNAPKTASGPDTEIQVANSLADLASFVRNSNTVAAVNDSVQKTINLFGFAFKDSIAETLTTEQQVQLAQRILDGENTLKKFYDTIGIMQNRTQVLDSLMQVQKEGTKAVEEGLESAKTAFGSDFLSVTTKHITAGEFARNYVIEKSNAGFWPKHMIDFVFDPVVSLGRTLDHYVKSKDFQDLSMQLGIAGTFASVVNPNFLVFMGTYLLFNHARLKWLFYMLASLSGNMANYHKDAHARLLVALIHNTDGDKETPLELRKPIGNDTNWFANALGELSHNSVMETLQTGMHMSWKALYDHGIWIGIFSVLVGFMINKMEYMWTALEKAIEYSGGIVVAGTYIVPYTVPSVTWLAKKSLYFKNTMAIVLGARRWAISYASKQDLARGKRSEKTWFVKTRQFLFEKTLYLREWIFLFLVSVLGPVIQKNFWFGKCLK